MPGISITTAVRTSPTGVSAAPASTWFVAGTSERGPIAAARLVTDLDDFINWYGDYTASFSLYQQVKTYFEEGGGTLYVARVVGASITSGSLTLNNSGATPSMTLTAANPGAWSSEVTAAVVAGTVSGFQVKIYHENVLKYSTADVATVTAAVAAINASSVASRYVTATALVGANSLAVVAATALTAGAAGSVPTAAQHVTALSLFGPELGAGAVSIPGQFSTTAWDGIIAHAVANNRIAILAFNPASDASAVATAASSYYSVVGAEYAAFYYPHVTALDPTGASITYSPEGYVAAKRSLAHNQSGPWQAPAGLVSQADYITGLSASVNRTAGDTLDAARVNAIRVIQGTIRIYGARSVSSDETNYRYITYRDLLNYIVTEGEKTLEDLVFSTIDGRNTIFGRTEARLIALLDPIRSAGGLYEAFDANNNQIDPGYSVEVSSTINPVAQLATGLVKAKVGARISSIGDRIEVEVTKSNLTSSVV